MVKKTNIKKISFALLLIISFSVFYYSFFVPEILNPAKLSALAACEPERFQEIQNQTGARIVGTTTRTESGEIQVEILEEDPNKEIIKHEQCHVSQFQTVRSFMLSCDNINLKILSEVECELSEELPDRIYNLIYPDV